MKKLLSTSGFALALAFTLLTSGCGLLSRKSSRSVHTYAIVVIDDTGVTPRSLIGAVENDIVQHLIAKGLVRRGEVFLEDPTDADTVFRVRLAGILGGASTPTVTYVSPTYRRRSTYATYGSVSFPGYSTFSVYSPWPYDNFPLFDYGPWYHDSYATSYRRESPPTNPPAPPPVVVTPPHPRPTIISVTPYPPENGGNRRRPHPDDRHDYSSRTPSSYSPSTPSYSSSSGNSNASYSAPATSSSSSGSSAYSSAASSTSSTSSSSSMHNVESSPSRRSNEP